jgi:phosphoribosyl 1,2-cyclic phosphodiesterase
VNGGDSSLVISAFELSHDACEPTGFCVEYGGKKLAVVTDTGIITDEIYEAVKDADMLVFEANHDEHMLMYGEYPYPLKMRIKSDQGHLSNAYAGEVLAKMLGERKSRTEEDSAEDAAPLRIMLAHLSFHNNIPLFARQTVEDTLHRSGFKKGKDYVLDVAAKEGLTFMPGIGKREEQC